MFCQKNDTKNTRVMGNAEGGWRSCGKAIEKAGRFKARYLYGVFTCQLTVGEMRTADGFPTGLFFFQPFFFCSTVAVVSTIQLGGRQNRQGGEGQNREWSRGGCLLSSLQEFAKSL